MEPLFALLQNNVLDRQAWKASKDLIVDVKSWIETTYDRRRSQHDLSRMTPIEFGTVMVHPTAIAA